MSANKDTNDISSRASVVDDNPCCIKTCDGALNFTFTIHSAGQTGTSTTVNVRSDKPSNISGGLSVPLTNKGNKHSNIFMYSHSLRMIRCNSDRQKLTRNGGFFILFLAINIEKLSVPATIPFHAILTKYIQT